MRNKRNADRPRDRQEAQRRLEGSVASQTRNLAGRQAGKQAGRQAGKQAGRQAGKQAGKQPERLSGPKTSRRNGEENPQGQGVPCAPRSHKGREVGPAGTAHSAPIHAAFHSCPRTWSTRLASKQTNSGEPWCAWERETGREEMGEGEEIGEGEEMRWDREVRLGLE